MRLEMAITAVVVTTLTVHRQCLFPPGEKTMIKDEINPFTLSSLFMLRAVPLGDSEAIRASEFVCSQMFWSLTT